MKKINHAISQRLNSLDYIFKFPVKKEIVENLFDPNINKDFEKYMLIGNDKGEIKFDTETIYMITNLETISNITSADLLDGTWWALPRRVRVF